MSLQPIVSTFPSIDTFRSSSPEQSPSGDTLQAATRVEPLGEPIENQATYLRNGARIISFDQGSNTALCTQDGQWSVWLLDEAGERIRGSYFESLSAAAFDYAERVMGYNSGEGDEEANDIDD